MDRSSGTQPDLWSSLPLAPTPHGQNGHGTSSGLPFLIERSKEWVGLELMLHHTSFPRMEYERVLQIMREFIAGFRALATVPASAVIWGSARTKPHEPAYLAAMETARLLAMAGFGFITGGGPGIMEAGNRGAREAGAISVGLPMESLSGEPPNQFQDRSLVFKYFMARKTMFVRYAEALVIFPGGFGTLDELFEALLLVQTSKIHPIPIILYDSVFWRGLLDWIQGQLGQKAKTISEQDHNLLTVSDNPQEICQIVVESFQENAGAEREPSLYH